MEFGIRKAEFGIRKEPRFSRTVLARKATFGMGKVKYWTVILRIAWAVGSRQWAVGSGQWAVGSGQWAVGSGQWAVNNKILPNSPTTGRPLRFKWEMINMP